jgi:hypothetical protein
MDDLVMPRKSRESGIEHGDQLEAKKTLDSRKDHPGFLNGLLGQLLRVISR